MTYVVSQDRDDADHWFISEDLREAEDHARKLSKNGLGPVRLYKLVEVAFYRETN